MSLRLAARSFAAKVSQICDELQAFRSRSFISRESNSHFLWVPVGDLPPSIGRSCIERLSYETFSTTTG